MYTNFCSGKPRSGRNRSHRRSPYSTASTESFTPENQISNIDGIQSNFNDPYANLGVFDERGSSWAVSRSSVTYPFIYETPSFAAYCSEQEDDQRFRTSAPLVPHEMTYTQPYCQLNTFHESNASTPEDGNHMTRDEETRVYNNENIIAPQAINSEEEMRTASESLSESLPSMRNGRNIFAEVLLRSVYTEGDARSVYPEGDARSVYPEGEDPVNPDLIQGSNDSFLQNATKTMSTTSEISSNSSCSASPTDLSAINGDPTGKSTVIRFLNDGSYNTSHGSKYYCESAAQQHSSSSPPPSSSSAASIQKTFLTNRNQVPASVNLSSDQASSGTGYTSVIVDAQQYQHFSAANFVQ